MGPPSSASGETWPMQAPAVPPLKQRVAKNIRVISIAQLIGEAIARIFKEESVSSLFD